MESESLVPVIIYLVEEIRHDCLVKIQLIFYVLFVPLEGLPPCPVFNRIIILDHAKVLFWFQVTAIIEGFHSSDSLGRISDQSVTSDVNLTFKRGLHNRFHQARLTVTAAN